MHKFESGEDIDLSLFNHPNLSDIERRMRMEKLGDDEDLRITSVSEDCSANVSRAESVEALPFKVPTPLPPTQTINPAVNTVNQPIKPDSYQTASKSHTIANIQNVFSDSQKVAYVGLCYLFVSQMRKRVLKLKKASMAFDKWAESFMEKLYIYLEISTEERLMIKNLAEHGLLPSDLASSLLADTEKALKKLQDLQMKRMQTEQDALDKGLPPAMSDESLTLQDSEASDIRYTILSHLFIISISDGHYDARSRAVLKSIADGLDIKAQEVCKLEIVIAEQLRLYEDSQIVQATDNVVHKRNKIDGKNRWLLAGIATVAGGAVIGLTAGLAAPFIGAGIGAALTTFGVTGAAGVGTFMAGTGGLALITTGGVLTGGGMSGVKMMKRTRGIEEFEFIGIEEALEVIAKNKEKRTEERRKYRRREARQQLEEQKAAQASPKPAQQLKKQKEGAMSGSVLESKSLVFDVKGMDKGASPSSAPPIPKRPSLASKSNTSPTLKDPKHNTLLWEANASELELNNMPREATTPPAADNASAYTDADLASTVAGDDSDDKPDTETKKQSKTKATNVLVTIAGWITNDADDHTLPYSTLTVGQNGDQYAMIWETKILLELGSSLRILVGEVASFIVQQGLQATLLPILMAGLTGPLWMIKLTYLVDNPWGNALTKAEKAGRVLADALMGQVQNNRPVSLVGFSLGARVIFYCLLELAAHHAYGIIEDVFLLGTPAIPSKREWECIASVVSGRIVNGYTQNDMMLGVLYRASSALWSEVAGLSAVTSIASIENIDLSEIVKGHLDYRSSLPRILKKCGFSVSSEEFEDREDEEEKEKTELEEERKRDKQEREKQQADRKKSIQPAVEVKKNVIGANELVYDEMKQISELDDIMQIYWQPREIKSTLPPLKMTSDKLRPEASNSAPTTASVVPTVDKNGESPPNVTLVQKMRGDFAGRQERPMSMHSEDIALAAMGSVADLEVMGDLEREMDQLGNLDETDVNSN